MNEFEEQQLSLLKEISTKLSKLQDLMQTRAVLDFDIHKEEFHEWIQTQTVHGGQYTRDLERMFGGKVISNPHEIVEILEDKAAHHKVAVKDFLRFLTEKGYCKPSEIIDFQNVVKCVISKPRVNRFTSTEKIIEAMEHMDHRRKLMLKFLVYSGVRMNEGCLMFKHFDPNKLSYRDGVAWYDMEEINKMRNISDKASKQVIVAFMPSDFAKELEQKLPMNVGSGIIKGDRFAKGVIYANQLRKWFSNHVKEQIREKEIVLGAKPESIINFMQGRTNRDALSKHYFDFLDDAIHLYKKLDFPV